jgi:hypothetical protein
MRSRLLYIQMIAFPYGRKIERTFTRMEGGDWQWQSDEPMTEAAQPGLAIVASARLASCDV